MLGGGPAFHDDGGGFINVGDAVGERDFGAVLGALVGFVVFHDSSIVGDRVEDRRDLSVKQMEMRACSPTWLETERPPWGWIGAGHIRSLFQNL